MKRTSTKKSSKLSIELPFANQKIAESICRAVSPENQEVPPGVKAITYVEGRKIISQINSDRDLWGVITTAEDLFEKIDLSMETISSIKKQGK
ncbi:MAG: hypothetical protein GF308_02215 [Candidatus Heimdallarchaeota archaeon]|nr:hypothetical protein [Candidatus Heimdallarchaeota archaeon]